MSDLAKWPYVDVVETKNAKGDSLGWWVVQHTGRLRADTGNPEGGIWHGPYETRVLALTKLWNMDVNNAEGGQS